MLYPKSFTLFQLLSGVLETSQGAFSVSLGVCVVPGVQAMAGSWCVPRML